MLETQDGGTRRVAARQICLAALHDGESQNTALSDAARVERGDAEMRSGAAEIYALNCGAPDVAQQCRTKLQQFFNDPDAEVRRTTARCFYQLEAAQLAKSDDLIEAFSTSEAFTDQASALLVRLKDIDIPLPATICSLANRAVDAWGKAASDMSTGVAGDAMILSELIVRFYAQAWDDAPREPALDAIDRMIEAGFMGIDSQLAGTDRL